MYAQLCLDTLRRRHRQQTLRHAGRESCESCARPGDFTLGISEEALVLVEGDESCRTTNHDFSHANLFFFPFRYPERERCVRMPAFAEFPMINVVHPAYHCFPNGGQGSFWPSGRRRLSCVLVFATVQQRQLEIRRLRATSPHDRPGN